MTVKELIELSGIKEEEGFETFDYAIPENRDGSYPHDGNAISVYRKEEHGIGFEIMTYTTLAKMALNRIDWLNPRNTNTHSLLEVAGYITTKEQE